MIVNIEDISAYGRFYSDIKDHVKWWFCLTDYKIYDTESVISKFNYGNEESIVSAGVFIPLFKTDVIKLEREFLASMSINRSNMPFCCDDISDFDRNFKIYIEENFLVREWYYFEQERLCKEAINWCKTNGIVFCRIKKME